MFSFFKKQSSLTDAGPTVVDTEKMSLSERMQWRDNMVQKAIKDAFADLEIIGDMYRFRVMPLDERHHYFVVMIDTTAHFAMCKPLVHRITRIENLIKEIAMNAYSIVVDGVYWKVSETLAILDKPIGSIIPSNRPKRSIEEIAADFGDTIPSLHMDDEVWERDHKIVDGKFYNTDISPISPT